MRTSPEPQVIYVERTGEGLAAAALVLGIVGMLFALLPHAFFISVACGAIGLALGIPAARAGRRVGRRAMAITGIVLSTLALLVGGIWGLGILADAERLEREAERIERVPR